MPLHRCDHRPQREHAHIVEDKWTHRNEARREWGRAFAKNYISNVEGARCNPTVTVPGQIIAALGVSWAEFGTAFDLAQRNR